LRRTNEAGRRPIISIRRRLIDVGYRADRDQRFDLPRPWGL